MPIELTEAKDKLGLKLDRFNPEPQGYVFRKQKGIDIAVYAYPYYYGTLKQVSRNGATPLVADRIKDVYTDYIFEILVSPLPLKRKRILQLDGKNVKLGKRGKLPDYVKEMIFSTVYLENELGLYLTGNKQVDKKVRNEREPHWKALVKQMEEKRVAEAKTHY